MQISVVIPVYNAARHLAESIESALMQPEVKEVLLIEDASKDDSLAICSSYASRNDDRVKLLIHPRNINKGAGESRNLGILNAAGEYVAFLDADDFYLPGRFAETLLVFQRNSNSDGVYETVGSRKEEHGLSKDMAHRAGTLVSRIVPVDPEKLFELLALAKQGYIHLNGLTLRRSSIEPDLLFDPILKQCQDTDFLLRWSARKKLYGGNPDRIVAIRRVHDQNRVFNIEETLKYRYLCLRKCALNSFYSARSGKARWAILNRMARASKAVLFAKKRRIPVTPLRLLFISTFLLRYPGILFSRRGKPLV